MTQATVLPRLVSRATLGVLAVYVAISVATTWPLVLHLGSDLPGDLGDPMLNTWILGWDLRQLPDLLLARPGAWDAWWNANIFHPEQLTLAYSEHLFAQALLVAPLHALGANLLICYNALFLATSALSAWGAFLLARDLCGRGPPAFLAGLLFGFATYRALQVPHLQVLSAQWMPFALLGVHRFLATLRPAPLACGALALIAQNLSCGYYLFYFSPFVAAFACHEMLRRGHLRRGAAWLGLGLAAIFVCAATLPFLLPYREVRARGVILRDRAAVEHLSADVFGYLSATPSLRLWGSLLHVFPKNEAELFPGIVPLGLAGLALAGVALHAWRARGSGHANLTRRFGERVALALLVVAVLLVAAAVAVLLGRPISAPGLRVTHLGRVLRLLLLCLGAAVVFSRRVRAVARELALSHEGFLAASAGLCFWLSLGPVVTSLGRPFEGLSLYGLLFRFVPGFDALRVPARFAMPFTLFLALLAAHGALRLPVRLARGGTLLLGALFLAESWVAPLPLSAPWNTPGLRRLPARPPFGDALPPIYRHVAELPAQAVLLEFPFGADPYDLYAVACSAFHGHRLVNGFSGARSADYERRRAALANPLADRARAERVLHAAGVTHVLVHEWAWYRPRRARALTRWLEALGATPLAEREGDVLLALPSRSLP